MGITSVSLHFIQDEKHNMVKKRIKISYDPDADVLSWELSGKGTIDRAAEMGNIIVHLTKNNVPILVEVLEASRLVHKSGRVIERANSPAMLVTS